jgi:glycolate oxidase FAD binding subunit
VDRGAGGAIVNTKEIAERVRAAQASRSPLRITGAATWMLAGRPVDGATPLDVSAHAGVVEYVPGDLTLTARAGTTLGEIARVTGAERQFLALDPHGDARGTIGATIATASAGPLAHAFGTPRDAILGLEAVTGDGAIIRAGGRVVKNVAGFDITRLLTGAWGTLGVITEVSLRLRAIPEVSETLALAVRDDEAPALDALLAKLAAAPVAPWAMELLSPALAARLGVAAHAALLVRLGGNAESVKSQRAAIAALGAVASTADGIWESLRAAEPAGAAVVRISARRSQLSGLWRHARDASADWPGAFAHASVGRGVVRCVLPAPAAQHTIAFASRLKGCAVIWERMPAETWSIVPSAVSDPLSQRAREAFDPRGILNPGILGSVAA